MTPLGPPSPALPELEPDDPPELEPDDPPELEPDDPPELEPDDPPELDPDDPPELDPEELPEPEPEPELEPDDPPELDPDELPELDPLLLPVPELPASSVAGGVLEQPLLTTMEPRTRAVPQIESVRMMIIAPLQSRKQKKRAWRAEHDRAHICSQGTLRPTR